ncbi:MAG: NAD(+)/NADH kinase [Eubacteriales bacterium]|nr:NAD(+)/NADH kinase [Eubacteriales bacterium]
MKRFYLIANPSKNGAVEMAQKMTEYLTSRGAFCEGSPQERQRGRDGCGYTDVSRIPACTECVITLGGDGTLIQAARDLVKLHIPLLGVNMGTLGYLTQANRGDRMEPLLDALLTDNFRLERRMMLQGCISGPRGERHGLALNDIVLTRQDAMQVLKFCVSVNGVVLNEYMADGMIVATPTGSTAYNLSAGGPIVTPGAELMVLTPICSHALNSSSIVLSRGDTVDICLAGSARRKQAVVFDGDQMLEIARDEILTIHRSGSYTTLIQLKNVSFLENLRDKMSRV